MFFGYLVVSIKTHKFQYGLFLPRNYHYYYNKENNIRRSWTSVTITITFSINRHWKLQQYFSVVATTCIDRPPCHFWTIDQLVQCWKLAEIFRWWPSVFIADTLEKIAECFSVYSNFRKVMNTETGQASDTLRCVHGLRVLTMGWIILGHTFFYKNFNLGSEYSTFLLNESLILMSSLINDLREQTAFH